MSAIIFGNKKSFMQITRKLMDLNFTNIIFLDSTNDEPDIPIASLLPFVNFLFLGNDSHESKHLERMLAQAKANAVPVIREDRLCQRVSFP